MINNYPLKETMKMKKMKKMKMRKKKNPVNNLQITLSSISLTYLLCTTHTDAKLTTKRETNSKKSICNIRHVEMSTTNIFFIGIISRQCDLMNNHLKVHTRSSLHGKVPLNLTQHPHNLGINLC